MRGAPITDVWYCPLFQVVSLGITSFTLCALGIDRFHAATSSSQPKARPVERCRSVLLKLLLVWLAALLLSSPEIFLWQLSQAVSPSSGRLVDSCTITPSSPLSLYLPDSLHSLLLRYHQVRLHHLLQIHLSRQLSTKHRHRHAHQLREYTAYIEYHKHQQSTTRSMEFPNISSCNLITLVL